MKFNLMSHSHLNALICEFDILYSENTTLKLLLTSYSQLKLHGRTTPPTDDQSIQTVIDKEIPIAKFAVSIILRPTWTELRVSRGDVQRERLL